MYDSVIYLLYFLIYSIFILIFGKHGFDKTDTLKGYYVANKDISIIPGFASFTATWFSAASFLGLPALIYAEGFRIVWETAAAWVFGGVLVMLLARRLYDYDILTIPEFFYERYDSKFMQRYVAVILILCYLFYIVIQFRGFGIVISTMLDIPYFLSVLLVYLFVLYTTFGGLYSVARSDMFHFCLLLVGAVIGFALVMKHTGGLAEIVDRLTQLQRDGVVEEGYTSFFNGTSFWTLFSAFMSLGIGVAVNPQYSLRVLASRSKGTAVKMIGLSLLFVILIYSCIFLLGIGARALYPVHIGSVEEVVPFLIAQLFDSPLKGFLLISIVAASISTANSQLLIIASSLVYDLGGSKLQNVHSEKVISISRAVIFIFATLAVLFSFLSPTGLVYFSGQLWGAISSTITFPLIGGLYGKGIEKRGVVYSMVTGSVTYLLSILFIPIDVQALVHPVIPGLAASGLVYFGFLIRGREQR